MANRPRLIVSTYLPDTLTIELNPADVAAVDVDLASALRFFVLNETSNADDLLKHITDASHAALSGGGSTAQIVWDIDEDGKVGLKAKSIDITLTWDTGDGSGTWLRDYLGFVNDPTTLALTNIGFQRAARTHLGGLYPLICTVTDIRGREEDIAQSRPTGTGGAATDHTTEYGGRDTLLVEVRLTDAYPHTTTWNEFTQLEFYLQEAKKGMPWRYYRDTTVLTPWARVSNALGYHEVVLDKKSAPLDPTPKHGNYYRIFHHKLLSRAHIDP